ncbi:MAG TPA: DUF4845 domain-containing protein [Steroidobacteraceae bacterium]|jgi:Domain of unknown function (DUF4845)|nr:DUF4845 domain-containing protein [Steroidobacteraceae bacterium]
MYERQRGITFVGWLVMIVPIALVAYAGMRVAPVYLNYMKVARALDATASNVRSDDSLNREAIRTTLIRHFEIDSIEYPMANDVSIQRDGRAWTLEAKYEDTAPLFANLSLLLSFDKVVHIGG